MFTKVSMIAKVVRSFSRDDTGANLPHIDLQSEVTLDQLTKYDTQFLIDDSGSMMGERWDEARDALMGLAEWALMHDDDGIEIFFLNAPNAGRTVRNKEEIGQLFKTVEVKPTSGTPTGYRLEKLLHAYVNKIEDVGVDNLSTSGIKALNVIVITDGEATDDIESVIVDTARRLDKGKFSPTQVGIQFIQIGDDKRATKALRKLDNCLSKSKNVRDIVDTRPYKKGTKLTPELLASMLLGGINRRIDLIKNPSRSQSQ